MWFYFEVLVGMAPCVMQMISTVSTNGRARRVPQRMHWNYVTFAVLLKTVLPHLNGNFNKNLVSVLGWYVSQ